MTQYWCLVLFVFSPQEKKLYGDYSEMWLQTNEQNIQNEVFKEKNFVDISKLHGVCLSI